VSAKPNPDAYTLESGHNLCWGEHSREEIEMTTPTVNKPERIDLNDKAACESWAHKLNVTHEKLREAVGAVGNDAQAVEKHLKALANEQKGGRGTM
jgi:hypothetical protein